MPPVVNASFILIEQKKKKKKAQKYIYIMECSALSWKWCNMGKGNLLPYTVHYLNQLLTRVAFLMKHAT